ncbi:MAG: hypothetical protein Ta2A_19030 [Treponemataceae bacterium]|nr:MAG: hypothetical protein Ta2A_19030 [Treponemataceae bacterium]
MSLSDEVYTALNAKLGYAPDPADDTSATYKPLVPGKIFLYFGKESEGEGPWLGFWVHSEVSKYLRDCLKVELHNIAATTNKVSDIYDDDVWVYGTIITGTVDWIVSTMEELERRAKFEIDK